MIDNIIIKGLKLYAYHGVNDEEKRDGQNFIVDCVLSINREKNRFIDDIESTVSYSKASRVIKKTMLKKSFDLIETAAEHIAYDLFKEFDLLLNVDVTLKKPEAPINMEFDYMAVNIKRKREDFD